MKFTVSTHSFLILIELNRSWELKNFDVLATGHHYGIALPTDDGTTFIAKGGKGELLTTYKLIDDDNRFQAQNRCLMSDEYRFIHQISYHHDGLYIANTDFNRLDFFPFNHNYGKRSYYFESVQYDVNHLNSVFPCGSDIVFCLLHNRGKSESELAIMSRNFSKGFRLLKRLSLWDRGCHNIFLDGNLLFYNASDKGDFVGVDLNKERVICRIHLPGHTKGLSVLDGYFIVGFSEHAKREERKSTKGYLSIIDRRDLEWIATVDLNHQSLDCPVGNVNEIRCLSQIDHGHALSAKYYLDYFGMKLSSGDLRYQIQKKFSLWTNKLKSVLNLN